MGHSIYLADEQKSIRELLHSFLASDGYTVRSFESGDALLEAFHQEPAELVILDIMMPGTDGLTVTGSCARCLTFPLFCSQPKTANWITLWVSVRAAMTTLPSRFVQRYY